MPDAVTHSGRSSSVASSAAPSILLSLAQGVEALGVSSSLVKTLPRTDNRKVEVRSSSEDQPLRRRSKPSLKEAEDVETSPQGSSEGDRKRVGIEKRIGRLERKFTNLKEFHSKSMEDLRLDLVGLQEELREEGSKVKKSKGKGKA